MIEFYIDREPQGKARPRFTKRGFAYTPKETREYEDYVRSIAFSAMGNNPPIKAPCYILFFSGIKISKSWSKKKKAEALNGGIEPTVKPDLDNIEKAILDSCNGVIFEDDKQVTKIYKEKFYTEIPGTIVFVTDKREEFKDKISKIPHFLFLP